MSYYDDVRAYHEKMGFPVGDLPVLPSDLPAIDRMKLILAAEALERHRDLLRCSDHPELFRTNQAKEPGPAGGKAIKPPGWSPPDLRRVLRETS